MDTTCSSQVELIREAFHYQSRFDGSTMVFKIDFPVTEDPAFSYLVKDLALLARTGFRVVIVPGAKEWIDAVLAEYGIVSGYVNEKSPAGSGLSFTSTRITTGAAIPFVEMAAFHVATRFITGLSASRVDAVIGNFVRARGLGVVEGLDMEHTGKVDKILTDSIGRLLNLGMVPILPCIGWSPAGKPYNVPSDEIALAASAALGAVKLFIVSVNGGLRRGIYKIPDNITVDEKGRIIRLSPQEAEAVLAANREVLTNGFSAGFSAGIAAKSQAGTAGGDGDKPAEVPAEKPLRELGLALRASKAGIERVHIIDGREEGAILRELFSNLGAGTMVYADEYESIRPLKGADIPDLLRLMEPLMAQNILVRRGAEDLREKEGDYVVFEIDGSIHACGALHDWGEGQGEIAAIATDPDYTDMGLGRRIVRYLIDRAIKQEFRRVFVLTTQTQDWFEFLGFRECTVESLPEKKRRNYDRKRKSKIFALEIEN
ncbi:MAG: amino-acid N-acetyltransferase [Treponema sp.]|jgi:amino-acid N-acetyltransferase|nr:amino-acid N-acetyltransferase [Treponema sp.]